MFSNRKFSVVLAFVLVFAFSAVAFAQTGTPTAEMGTNSITVADQAVANDSVVIAQVMATEPGFVVIHADNNGAPGAVLGFAPVTAGTNDSVTVPLTDVSNATNTLWAMLHSGTGTFNVEANPPVRDANNQIVMKSFTVTGLQGAATATAEATAVATAETAATPTVAATSAVAAAATPAATTAAAGGVTATGTASPATLPTTGGNNSSMLVVLLLGLGGLSLLAGLGLNLARRTR